MRYLVTIIAFASIAGCKTVGSDVSSAEREGEFPVGRLTQEQCDQIMIQEGVNVEEVRRRNYCSCNSSNVAFKTDFHFLSCLKAYGAVSFDVPSEALTGKPRGESDSLYGIRNMTKAASNDAGGN